MNSTAGHIIIVCWSIFYVVWLVTAAKAKRTVEKQSVWSDLAHRLPVGFGWWILLFPKWSSPFNHQILPHTDAFEFVAAAICVCGLLFTLWARQTLAGNWSSNVTFKQGHELIRRGPYHFVRHPIYTGLLVMCLGTAILIGQLRGVFGLFLMTIGFWIKLRQEERLLTRHFPEAYPAYQHEVKALVPFLI